MEWNDETIARLRVLWAEGHSTAEIGRRMVVSKNAVVGKAHRLNLAARPSPIRRDGVVSAPPRAASPKRLVGSTLPSFASLSEPMQPIPSPEPAPPGHAPDIVAVAEPPKPAFLPVQAGPVQAGPVQPGPVHAVPVHAVAVRPAPVRVVPASRPVRTMSCCWPIGEPGTPSFRFCDAAAANGKPYCGEHAAVAYVKVRDRREEAA